MLRRKLVKGLLGVSAVAALFGALAVQAQTAATQPAGGQSTSGQAGQTGKAGQAGQTGAQGSTASGTGAAAATLSKADQKIVMNMAQENMSEIEAARMAQTKSQSEQVKNFAQQMIDDHSKALTEVQQLAQARGVTLPNELDKAHRARADKLSALSGEEFDRAYMAQAGVDHKKTHTMLRRAQNRAKDPEVKALAARMAPTVDQHLNAAQQLRGSSTGKGAATGSGGGKLGQ